MEQWAEIRRRVLRVGLSARTNRGGGGGPADSYTLTTRAGRLTSHRLALGTRHTRYTGPETRGDTTWFGANLDLGLLPGWYLLLSAESTRGDVERNDQIYSSLTYRF